MSMSTRPVQIVAGVIVALIVFGAGFVAGTSRAASGVATTASANVAGGGRRGADAAGAAASRNIVNGQILSLAAGSITVEVRTPGRQGASPTVTSELILVGPTTRVVKTTETDVKLADLKAGDQITVAGTPDTTTGSVSAQAIVLGGNNVFADILGGGRRGRGPVPSPSPSPAP